MSGLGNATVTRRGFTLTEMLVVMAVIAILAGMVLAVLPGVTEKRTRSVVRAELAMLVGAIEYYKEKHGFYPPDNTNNATLPPLFYELVGARREGTKYYPLNGAKELPENLLKGILRNEGIFNSAEQESDVKNFLPSLKPRQYVESAYNSDVLVLKVPAKGPKDPNLPPDVDSENKNAWRYVVAKPGGSPPQPTHNPNTFDLWADVQIRGKVVTIGNWKQEK